MTSNPSLLSNLKRQAHARTPKVVRRRVELALLARHEPELALTRDLLVRSDWLVDVGANHGSYIVAGLVAGANITAIEPQPALAAELRGLYGPDGVRIVESAIGPESGVAQLWVPSSRHTGTRIDTRSSLLAGANPGFDQTSIDVPVARLDQIADRADMLKIDVEGFEVQVIESAERLIERWRPTVLVEVERRHHEERPFLAHDLLLQADYIGLFARGHSRDLRPLNQFNPDRDQPADLVKDPGANAKPAQLVNNFLFIHPSRFSSTCRQLTRRGWHVPG